MKLTSDMLLVVHVPKTAGTSFRRALEKSFGEKDVIRDYGVNANATTDAVRSHLYSDANVSPEALVRSLSDGGAKVLIGHFPVKKYLSYFEPNNIIAFVRDPLERACSEYLHLVRHRAYVGSFDEFIKKGNIINLQSRLLQNIPKEAIIGITEHYTESLIYLNAVMGLGLRELKANTDKLGGGSEFAKKLSQSQLNQFYKLNQKDIDLYEKCSSRFSAREIPEVKKSRFGKWFHNR